MANLKACKDCGHHISKNAVACPNCGAKNKKTSLITWIVLLFIGIPFLWGIISSASGDKDTEQVASIDSQSAEDEPASPYETLPKFDVSSDQFDSYIGSRVAVVEMAVKQQMKDPESTKFRNWRYVKASDDLPATVCGEVTSKNSFNGQTGYRHFLVKMDTTEFGIENSTDGFNELYNKLCILK